MFDDVLFPTDGSEENEASLAHVLDLAERFDATVTVLFVANTNRDSVTVLGTEVVDALVQEGADIVERVAATVRERGVDCRTDVVQGDPGPTVADYAADRGMDLVAMPTHGRTGLTRYLLGSVTEKTVRLSDVPVLTLPMGDARAAFPYENVLIPTDGSDVAAGAADRAIDLAAALDATLHAVSVVDDASLGFDVRSASTGPKLEKAAEEAVAPVAERAAEEGVENVVESVRRGTVHEELLAYADENDVDAVALGTTGRGGTDRILLGSVAERVVRTSSVPVLTVRG